MTWLAVLSILVGVSVSARYFWHPIKSEIAGVPELDSFGEPDIAIAVLKKHAEELISTYKTSANNLQVQTSPGLTAEWLRRFKEELSTTTKPVIALEFELLPIFYTHALWHELLDCYLDILKRCPSSPATRLWARYVLDVANHSGRLEEVLDELQHVARFHKNASVALTIKKVLGDRASPVRLGSQAMTQKMAVYPCLLRWDALR